MTALAAVSANYEIDRKLKSIQSNRESIFFKTYVFKGKEINEAII